MEEMRPAARSWSKNSLRWSAAPGAVSMDNCRRTTSSGERAASGEEEEEEEEEEERRLRVNTTRSEVKTYKDSIAVVEMGASLERETPDTKSRAETGAGFPKKSACRGRTSQIRMREE